MALLETFVWPRGGPPLWARHVRRLQAGLRRLGWPLRPIPMPPARMGAAVAGRLVVSRAGERLVMRLGTRPIGPNRGRLLVARVDRPLAISPQPGLKLLSHAGWRQLRPEGVDELLLVDGGGHVMEGTIHNVFWEDGDARVCTPDLSTGCVDGIGRGWVIEALGRMGVGVRYVADAYPRDCIRAMWLTNAVMGPRSVREVLGCGELRRGEWVHLLAARWEAETRAGL